MIESITLNPRANVYFEGKCVSYSFLTANGEKKSAGVILPSTLTFSTNDPEIMEVIDGTFEVGLGDGKWQSYGPGERFNVAANASFVIKVSEPFHYICHFG